VLRLTRNLLNWRLWDRSVLLISEHEDGAGFSSVADWENICSELQVSAMGEQGEDSGVVSCLLFKQLFIWKNSDIVRYGSPTTV
jgi:hypothetical protein